MDYVFVLSRAGRSRSATIVIGYLMLKMKWHFQEAFAHVSKKRSISLKLSFTRQLVNLEKANLDFDAAFDSYMREKMNNLKQIKIFNIDK